MLYCIWFHLYSGYQQLHGSPIPSFPPSMRSPAFSSPTSHVTGGTTSTGSYSGQLPSMSPASRYSGSSPGNLKDKFIFFSMS